MITWVDGHRPQGSLRIAAVLAVSALLLAVTAVPTRATAADTFGSVPGGVEARAVDSLLQRMVADGGFPGVQVAIIRGGQVLHTSAAGTGAGAAPVTTSTPMRMASVSKAFTALAVMQLVDAGQVDLDQSARELLPELSIDDPRVDDITVRHLLNHSSGIADRASPDEYRPGPRTTEQAVFRLRTAHLVADPGTQWNYSNPNYHVAARLVEVVSGEPFDTYLQRHVFDPLGMTSTSTVTTAAQDSPGVADGHGFAYGQAVPIAGPDYFTAGAGGVVSTAEDMARWLVMQQDGGLGPDGTRVVSTEAITEMHRNQAPGGAIYGLGWYTAPPADDNGPVRTSHGGANAIAGAYQGLFPGGYGLAVLTNVGATLTGPSPDKVVGALVNLLQGEQPVVADTRGALVTDLVLTALAVTALGLGVHGVLRARRWAHRRACTPRGRTALRLLPYLLALVAVASVPRVQLALLDRAAPWPILAHVAPIPTGLLASVALASATVLLTRLMLLTSSTERVPHPRHRGAESPTKG